MATAELIRLGHRRIATITGRLVDEVAQDRLDGFRQALSEAAISFDGLMVMAGDGTLASGHEAAKRLLSLAKRPTAIFCHSAPMAAGCFDAAAEAGRRIPKDISVIGYDDDVSSEHLRPRLNALELPRWSMGVWAVNRASVPAPAMCGTHGTQKLDYSLIETTSCRRL